MSINTYNDRDPRFNFTIMDSDAFNVPISVLHDLDVVCYKKNTNVKDCRSQRYENCKESKGFDDVNTHCRLEPRDRLKMNKLNNLKKLNKNSYYDKTRISKQLNPNVVVDYDPNIIDINERFDLTSFYESCDESVIKPMFGSETEQDCKKWGDWVMICCIILCIIILLCSISSSIWFILD